MQYYLGSDRRRLLNFSELLSWNVASWKRSILSEICVPKDRIESFLADNSSGEITLPEVLLKPMQMLMKLQAQCLTDSLNSANGQEKINEALWYYSFDLCRYITFLYTIDPDYVKDSFFKRSIGLISKAAEIVMRHRGQEAAEDLEAVVRDLEYKQKNRKIYGQDGFMQGYFDVMGGDIVSSQEFLTEELIGIWVGRYDDVLAIDNATNIAERAMLHLEYGHKRGHVFSRKGRIKGGSFDLDFSSIIDMASSDDVPDELAVRARENIGKILQACKENKDNIPVAILYEVGLAAKGEKLPEVTSKKSCSDVLDEIKGLLSEESPDFDRLRVMGASLNKWFAQGNEVG